MAEENEFDRAVKQKRLMLALKEDPAFKYLIDCLEVQIKQRYDQLLRYPTGLDSIAQGVYTSGEIAGLRMVQSFPDTLIAYAQASIDTEKHKRDMEQDDGAQEQNT